MHAMALNPAAEKEAHFNIRGHASSTEAQKSRSRALIARANDCCPCPLPGGSACRQCISCNQILSKTCQEDGLNDDWCEYWEDNPEVCFRKLDNAFLFDFSPAPINPGLPGAIYTIGVSQVAIFRPAPVGPFGVPTYASLSIVTLFSPIFADFPTPASLAAGEFAIYLPYGSGITTSTPSGTIFGLSGVSDTSLAVFSNSYASLADVPYYLINIAYKVYGPSTTTTTTLYEQSIKMYETGWYMQTTRVMNSSTLSTADAFTNALEIVNIVTPLSFWQLALSEMNQVFCIRFKYIKAVYTCKKRCYSCNNNPSRGCNGSRCGTVNKRVMFTRDNSVSGMENQSDFVQSVSDLTMLDRVLNEGDKSFQGLTIHPKSFRIMASVVGDNLSFCPKWVLREAARLAKQREREIKMIPSIESEANSEQLTRYMSLIAGHQRAAFLEALAEVRLTRAAQRNAANTTNVSSATAGGTPSQSYKSSATTGPVQRSLQQPPYARGGGQQPANGSIWNNDLFGR